MRYLTLLFLFLLQVYQSNSQGYLLADGANTIDFSLLTGSGFASSPAAGQLDSDEWKTSGFSDGDSDFGTDYTTGDYARGTSSGGVTTGGVYIFDVGGGNEALGVQPGGSDFTPGFFYLRTTNNTGSAIQEIQVSYDIYEFNDQNRSNSIAFSHSDDDVNYEQITSLDFVSEEASDAIPSWQSTVRSTTLTGLDLLNASNYYLSWGGTDVSGSGSRDELAIDNIIITTYLDNVTAPRFISDFPVARNITTDNFDLVVQLDEIGTAYYVVLPAAAPAPDSDQVKAGENASGASAGISGSMAVPTANNDAIVNIPGLVEGLTYDVYIVAEDDEGSPNLQTTPSMIQIEAKLESIAITEFISNPFGVENGAEWIEIYNFGGSAVDLNGWTLKDEGIENVTISSSSLIIESDSYLILANDKSTFETQWLGGMTDSRVIDISNFVLGNASDQIILSNSSGSTIWSLAYDDDETEGNSTYLVYSESTEINSYGSMALPGVVRNGNDNLGTTLGYEGNNHTTDGLSYTSTQGDIGSPLDGNYNITLPVELLSWAGTAQPDHAKLKWSTSSELNNMGFFIEKSTDGEQFIQLDFIKGNNTTNEINRYNYEDYTFTQSAYFRLTQIDHDGTETLTRVIYLENRNKGLFKLYPNPISNQVFLTNSFDKQILSLRINDLQSNIYSGKVNWEKARQIVLSLRPGIYHITINKNSQRILNHYALEMHRIGFDAE
ncbi:MAG: lamin tail domain-containing protein [Reichenbachiella sp.]|uniref:lamin tail domain-containing protein n=1 Tax=Reichenbachiella sp. TaxID=2184521 RepID=UPI003298FFCD